MEHCNQTRETCIALAPPIIPLKLSFCHSPTTRNERCYKFLQNQCGRSSEDCLFTHQTAPNVRPSPTPPTQDQQDFQQGPTPQLYSPRVDMPTISERIQNQQRIQNPLVAETLPVNIQDMIPQIVSQVLVALTQMQLKVYSV